MRGIAPIPALLLVPILFLTPFGCGSDSPTESEPPRMLELRVVHAAATAGGYAVAVDSVILHPNLEIGGVVRDSVPVGNHEVRFASGGVTLGRSLRSFGSTHAVVLLGPDPAGEGRAIFLELYSHSTPAQTETPLEIINGVAGTNLTIELRGEGLQVRSTVPFRNASSIGVSPGSYEVTARGPDSDDVVSLGRVTLPPQRSFLIVYPAEEGGPGRVLVF